MGGSTLLLLFSGAPAPTPPPRIWPFRARRASGATGPLPPPAATFWEALEAWILAKVPALPAGVAPDRAPQGTRLPYAEYDGDGPESLGWMSEGQTLGPGEFRVSVYAKTKAQAHAIALAVASAVKDAPLAFAEGRLQYLRPRGIRRPIPDPDPDPDGDDCYQAAVVVDYSITRHP